MTERQWTFTETQIFLRLCAQYDIENRGTEGTDTHDSNLKKVQLEMGISGYYRDCEPMLIKWRTLRHQYKRYLKQNNYSDAKKSSMFVHADAMKAVFDARPHSFFYSDNSSESADNKPKIAVKRSAPAKEKSQVPYRTVLRPIKPKIASPVMPNNQKNSNATQNNTSSNIGHATLLQLLQEQSDLLTKEIEKSEQRYQDSLNREKQLIELEKQDRQLLRHVLFTFHKSNGNNKSDSTNDADVALMERLLADSSIPSRYQTTHAPAIVVVPQPVQVQPILPTVVTPSQLNLPPTPKKFRLILSKDVKITNKINVNSIKKEL